MAEQTNYLEDDWNDNALSGRTSAEKGVYYSYHDGGTGDLLKGIYRPVWTRPRAAGNISLSNGTVTWSLDDSVDYGNPIVTPTAFTVGRFEGDYQFTATSNDFDICAFDWIHQADNYGTNWAPNEALYTSINDDANYRVFKNVGGTGTALIDSSWDNDTTTHRTAYERDAYGNHELFYDGVSKGTGSDTYFPPKPLVTGIRGHDNPNRATNRDLIIDNLVVQ